jgi:serine/threonine-protein kinase RsbW
MPPNGRLAPVDMRVPLTPAAAGVIRHAIADVLAGQVPDRVLSDAQLVLSELVTNSVRHAGVNGDAAIHVSAALTEHVLRLVVEDAGTAGKVIAREPSVDGGGFGLNLVAMLAQTWGVDRDGATRVWAELARAPVAR